MRIAYVTETYPPELNGVSLTVERTVRYLRARGHNVELIRPRQPGEARLDADDELRTAGCAIPVYREMRFGLSRVGPLLRRFARTRPEVVHLATPGPLAWAALAAARALAIPTTSDFRTNFHQYSRYYGIGALAAPCSACCADSTISPSARSCRRGRPRASSVRRVSQPDDRRPRRRQRALRAGAPQRLAARQWQAGIGAGAADGRPRRAREERRARPARVRAGAPEPPRAAPRRRRRRPGASRLQSAYPDARFVGVQRGADLAAHYASADLFLFPSLSDTFGNVVLEALASGLPVASFASPRQRARRRRVGRPARRAGDEAAFVAAVESLTAPEARSNRCARGAGRRAPRHLARGARALRGASGRHRPCTRNAAVPRSRRGLTNN
jgi:glycosyltransferase involved in cell wall biosynthesis